jgi:hypothetical protein
MSEREDYEGLADHLDEEADQLEHEGEKLDEQIGDARDGWERKRADPGVPGAPPRVEDANPDAPGDEVNPGDAGREEHEAPDTDEPAQREGS